MLVSAIYQHESGTGYLLTLFPKTVEVKLKIYIRNAFLNEIDGTVFFFLKLFIGLWILNTASMKQAYISVFFPFSLYERMEKTLFT